MICNKEYGLAARSAVIQMKINKRQAEQDAERGRAWIELSKEALRNNVAALRSRLPDHCRLMPAIKADAYGHGAVLLAGELNRMGVNSFCVACAAEGAELRTHGVKGEILVLGFTHEEQFDLLYKYQLMQTVIDYDYAEKLNRYHKKLHVHIGIDTGMHRLGERSENIELLCKIYEMKNLVVDGLFTHLCTADTDQQQDQEFTRFQARAFYDVIDALKERGYPCPKLHLLSSYGVVNYPEFAEDYARVGIALYGLLSTKEDTLKWKEVLTPVLSLKVRVATVKNLYAGESAGYGLQFTANRDMKIATLAIGYADGLPRALSNGVGKVLINGAEAPVIGRICMDQTLVDVSGVPDIRSGDTAVIIGRSGGKEISACDLAEQTGTITNEILSRMGKRLVRILV